MVGPRDIAITLVRLCHSEETAIAENIAVPTRRAGKCQRRELGLHRLPHGDG